MRASWGVGLVVFAMSGCAGWVDEESISIDTDDIQPTSKDAVFGYGGTPNDPEVDTSDELWPVETELGRPGISGGSAAFAVRQVGHRCTLRVVTARIQPRLSATEIRRVVQRHENEVRACYNRALLDDASLEGRVTMRFLIQSDGSVAHAHAAESELEHPSLWRCLATKIGTWSFPVPAGGGVSVVSYPYVFSVPRRHRS